MDDKLEVNLVFGDKAAVQEIQNSIVSLDEAEITKFAKVISHDMIFNSEQGKHALLHIILDISNLQPCRCNVYTKLLMKLCEEIADFGQIIKYQMYKDLFRGPSFYGKIPSHYFIYSSLLSENILTIDEITQLFATKFRVSNFNYSTDVILMMNEAFNMLPVERKNKILMYPMIREISSRVDYDLSKEFMNIQRNSYLQKLKKIIMNDDIEKFQLLASEPNFDMNATVTTVPSFSEFSGLNIDKLTILDVACLYGSIRIFKFLLLNCIPLTKNSFKMSIIGGSIEILRIHGQNGNAYDQSDVIIAIKSYQNHISNWMLENQTFPESSFSNIITNNIEYIDLIKYDRFDGLVASECINFIDNLSIENNANIIIYKASENNSRDLFYSIINHPNFEINERMPVNQCYPIQIAIRLCYNESIEYLIKNKCDMDIHTQEGHSLSDLSRFYGDSNVHSLIPPSDANRPDDLRTMFPGIFSLMVEYFDERNWLTNISLSNESKTIGELFYYDAGVKMLIYNEQEIDFSTSLDGIGIKKGSLVKAIYSY